MDTPDQAAGGGDWRMQLREMRTVAGLRAEAPQPDAAERLTDRALVAAAQNPDHSEAGRAAAADAARARNVTVPPWRLKVPGFINAAQLARGDKLFFGWGRRVRKFSGALIWLALLAMFACVIVAMPATEEALQIAEARGVAGASGLGGSGFFWTDEASTPLRVLLDGEPSFEIAIMAERIGLVFAGVFGFSLLIWLAASWARRRPARLLLLRKFNNRALSAPMQRMMARELRAYGHIATLSDKHLKEDHWGWLQFVLLSAGNPIALIWFAIGTPFRLVWRLFDRSSMGPATVLNARDYRNLARRLRDRMGLNLQIATVQKEAFLVRTSDVWWRMVVHLLMGSCDAIVVDLSQVSAGTAWELDVIRDEGAAKRCVFVALWGKLEEAQAALDARGIDAIVHHYAPDGEMQRRPAFRAAMLGAMRATHGAA